MHLSIPIDVLAADAASDAASAAAMIDLLSGASQQTHAPLSAESLQSLTARRYRASPRRAARHHSQAALA